MKNVLFFQFQTLRKNLFANFDDEKFNLRFRLTKNIVTKLLEQVTVKFNQSLANWRLN